MKPGERVPVAPFHDFIQALPDRVPYVLKFPGGATTQFLLHRE